MYNVELPCIYLLIWFLFHMLTRLAEEKWKVHSTWCSQKIWVKKVTQFSFRIKLVLLFDTISVSERRKTVTGREFQPINKRDKMVKMLDNFCISKLEGTGIKSTEHINKATGWGWVCKKVKLSIIPWDLWIHESDLKFGELGGHINFIVPGQEENSIVKSQISINLFSIFHISFAHQEPIIYILKLHKSRLLLCFICSHYKHGAWWYYFSTVPPPSSSLCSKTCSESFQKIVEHSAVHYNRAIMSLMVLTGNTCIYSRRAGRIILINKFFTVLCGLSYMNYICSVSDYPRQRMGKGWKGRNVEVTSCGQHLMY